MRISTRYGEDKSVDTPARDIDPHAAASLARTTTVNPSATPDETFVDSLVRALHSAGAKHQAR
jgi:hypothetical protein